MTTIFAILLIIHIGCDAIDILDTDDSDADPSPDSPEPLTLTHDEPISFNEWMENLKQQYN